MSDKWIADKKRVETTLSEAFDNNPARAFSRIREAREILRAKADQFVLLQLRIIEAAIKAGDFESASKANQWLMEHTPADAEGLRMIDHSIDKIKEMTSSKPSGPQINIGFALGGVTPKELPPVQVEVIDQEVEDSND